MFHANVGDNIELVDRYIVTLGPSALEWLCVWLVHRSSVTSETLLLSIRLSTIRHRTDEWMRVDRLRCGSDSLSLFGVHCCDHHRRQIVAVDSFGCQLSVHSNPLVRIVGIGKTETDLSEVQEVEDEQWECV